MSIRFDFKNLRKIKHISQQKLAIELGISQSYINQLENNSYKRSPSIELMDALAHKLGVCFLDIIECNNNCVKCRHRINCNKNDNSHNNENDTYYFL